MSTLLLVALPVAAAQTSQDLAVWSSVFAQADLDREEPTGPRLWLDLHARRTDASFLGIVRPAVGWDLSRRISIYAGYAWIPQDGEATGDLLLSEHRVWEQAVVSTQVSGLALAFRPRLEQRFLQDQPEVGHRVRLWGRVGAPIRGDLSLAVSEEVFLGLAETAWAPGGFDQNRLFAGPALPVSDLGRIELGYLNVFLVRDSGNTLLHAVSANLFLAWP